MSEEKIERIEKIGDEAAMDKVEPTQQPSSTKVPDSEQFTTLMQQEQASLRAARPEGKASLMDTVRDMNFNSSQSTGKVSTQSLLAQTEQVISKIDSIKETLETPNASIKSPTHVKLLENKLSHIDESLKIALSKAGLELTPDAGQPKVPLVDQKNPIERFLGLLTDGQWQLDKLGQELTVMGSQNKEISPVNMMAIQIKVGQIGQELQLFYSLLSKGLESVKTIMNIQV